MTFTTETNAADTHTAQKRDRQTLQKLCHKDAVGPGNNACPALCGA